MEEFVTEEQILDKKNCMTERDLKLLFLYLEYNYLQSRKSQLAMAHELNTSPTVISALCQYMGVHYHVLRAVATMKEFVNSPEVSAEASKLGAEAWQLLEKLV